MTEPSTSLTRGFLFADLRDYTRFVESHGDQAAAELLTRYRLLVREVIARSLGAEIQTEGDSFYVVFTSASAAVNGGLAILEAAAAAGSRPGDVAIKVGVGVHAGETAETPEGFVGSAVNLAARICALAGPGELLVSDTVHGLTRTFLAVQFVPRGRRRLKGIAEPVLVYRVLPPTAGAQPVRSGAGARGRLSGSRMLVAAAIGLSLALFATGGLVGLLTGAGPFGRFDTFSSPDSSSSASASSSGDLGTNSADPGPALTAAEVELLRKLPAAISEDCVSGSVVEGSAGGSVSLRCQLPLSAAAETVWVDEFPTPETLAGAFSDAAARTRAPPGDCETMPLANGTWEVPNVHSGKLLCHPEDDAAWVVWTYDDDRVLVRARRGGGDWEALHAWWRQTAIFWRAR